MKKLLLIIFILLFAIPCFADCTPNLTVCSSGCDYSVLNDAVTDLETNCSSPTEPLSISISGSWTNPDTTAVSISGINTTETNNLTIATISNARHEGKYSTAAYRLVATNSYTKFYVNNMSNIAVDGLQFRNNNSFNYNDAGDIFSWRYGNNAIIKNCIFVSNRTGTNEQWFVEIGNSVGGSFHNNLIYEIGNKVATGLRITATQIGHALYVYNNTVYGFNYGIRYYANTGGAVKNNICNNNSHDYYNIGDTMANNIDEDGSGEITTTLTFTDAVNEDFSLASSDTAAIDAGVDLGSPYNVDIIGTIRPQGPSWDIGAFEYISAEPPARRRIRFIN